MEILSEDMGINRMSKPAHITILGGGLAGLAVGYYARKRGLPFTIYEARNRLGGNAITLKHGDFLFDSGAHRLHDRDREVTKEVQKLLGEELSEVDVPSQIYHNGRLVDFPLSPLNLMTNLGLYTFSKAILEVLGSRMRAQERDSSFESFALHTYGETIADRFLLNYSEKLWGAPCSRLSPNIAGRRMKGLDLNTFLTEGIFGRKAKTQHLEGSFYYPKMGIGSIAERLAESCGEENIRRNSGITGIFHNHRRIQAIEINGEHTVNADEVVSTLPLGPFLQMMDPSPPKEILLLGNSLRYRSVILVALFLNRESVTRAATVYFPDGDFPFTRIYEPKNRSTNLSPPGKTSLVAEIPCQMEDESWVLEDYKLTELVRSQLIRISCIKEEEIIGASVGRISYGYPILEIGFEEKVRRIDAFLKSLSNLKVSGRNGRFVYAWIHDMMRFGKDIVDEYAARRRT
jgi:protoporphyrinogen oxidase